MTMNLARGLAVLAITTLAVLTNGARAHDEATDQEEVLVQGQRWDELQVYVRTLSEAGPTDQLARWMTYVCTSVIGVLPEHAEMISRRIAALTEALDLDPAPKRCDPKLTIIFSSEADATAAQLADTYTVALGTGGRGKLVAFADSDAPVRWVNIVNECGEGCGLMNSRIRQATTPAFSLMLVVVDNTALAGFDVREIADYLAMVALTSPSQTRRHAKTSVLSMFERERRPGAMFGLTAWDQAYLDALYDLESNLNEKQQRERIEMAMRDALE
ncbi:hypothetical protein F3N42_02075 [Marinihelvus fidelis]|uniref:DUF2927 domain-containing protein n=1 Tax=Marinihelvus fidelis TaxID=2613842 RepID=A0A5N0TDW7_9GAMM|nr:hypothetical protein [Marinihelvus fidelis]KAA9133170.1 hypothetical protein F3N42_02075 [Marinihelvus fidelis]